MEIVVTGASGMIGRALASRLTQLGHEVRPIGRQAVAGGFSWDPSGGRLDPGALAGADAVVHLAGEPIAARRWNDAQKQRILQSRVDGTELLASTIAGLDQPPSVFLSGSAIGYYGDRGDTQLTERSDRGQGFLADVCERWETATGAATDAGVRVAHLRTGIVLDRRGGALAKQLPLFRAGIGGRLGDGSQWWSWITLEDEVEAIVWLLDREVSGPVNLTAPAPVTNAEFTAAVGSVLGRPTRLPVPKIGPRLLLGRELAEELLYTSAKVLPTALEASGYRFRHPTVEVALRSVLDRPAV